MSGSLQFIGPEWPALPGVRAVFTLRTGGVSIAPFESLNLGEGLGDAPEAVLENRRRLRERLELPEEPAWLEQVHGIDVVELDALDAASPRSFGVAPKADAAVTRATGRVCAVRVADCMPVLFAARDGSAVGVAHAGWRGMAGGVFGATLRRLGVPAPALIAWLGPAIGPKHFEVGDDVRSAFVANDSAASAAFVANARGRWQCDLYMLARRKLTALGITDIYGGGCCTYAAAEQFFSYRRDGQCGRMAALIWREG